jgi:predicted RNA-binding protein
MSQRYFLFNTSDPEVFSEDAQTQTKKGSAYELILSRLQNNYWPLYSRTCYRRHITPGTNLAFYVGGAKEYRKHIIARSSVAAVFPADRNSIFVDSDKFLTDVPAQIVELGTVCYLKDPVNFREILPELSICPKNIKYWGVIMQGGVTEIPERDWQLLFA